MVLKMLKLFLCLVVVLSLDGCRSIEGMFVLPIYLPEELWFRAGVDKVETNKIYANCCPECPRYSAPNPEKRIAGEKCMLANGFKFRDYGWLHSHRPHSVCSKRFAEFSGLKSYMDLPSCQSLHGQYKP